MIASIEARDYRNLTGRVSASLGPGLTVFHGANGAGKTNLLDAIHFGLTGTSIRPGTVKHVIGFDADSTRVELEFTDSNGDVHNTLVSIDRSGERRSLIDGSAPSAAVSVPRVALFHPDRLQTIKGPPAHRRSLIDQFSAALAPSTADLRSRYGRTLAQRNAQLRRVRSGEVPVTELEVWDHRLARDAEPLVQARASAVEQLAPRFTEAASSLGLEEPVLSYRPRATGDVDEIRDRLAELRSEAEGRSYVMYGPHLDDLRIQAGGRQLKQFGSQGQQRSAVLALLLAERAALAESGREAPVLLLDDVMSELDPKRRGLLIETAVAGGQVVVTATEPAQVPEAGGVPDSTRIRIDAGVLTPDPRSPELSEAA